ncbi:MAG: hypothetical protein DCC55_11140 [Chloroflexi bacterium]|nr:MAG: hypothetical protein DCC55_11140 [Chloroflexota bacterium]
MKTPFPGMDPYLEHPALWPDVRNRLIAAIADAVAPVVAPRYYVALERRTYLLKPDDIVFIGRPDIALVTQSQPVVAPTAPMYNGVLDVDVPMADEVGEDYLEIHEVRTGKLVTLVEVLSPTNKLDKNGREQYEAKRAQVLTTRTNLVEIDLLCAGEPMAVIGRAARSDYRILVSRGHQRPRAQLYFFSLRQPIPQFPLPLLPGEAEPLVDLNTILHALYTRARFDLRLDYAQPSVPPLSPEDADWAATLDYPPPP